MDRTTGDMTAYRHDPRKQGSLGSDRVMALSARPPRRPLDRHAGCGPRPPARRRPASSSTTAATRSVRTASSANGVTSMLEDREGRLWLGTYGGGLETIDPETGRFTHYRFDPKDPASLSGDKVSSLAEAADGRLWVGTMEKGLNLFDPRSGRFVRHEPRPGDAAQPALGRRPHAVRGRGGRPLGGHARRPEPPAPGRPLLRDLHDAGRPAERRRLRRPQRPPGAALAEHEQRALVLRPARPASSRATG